VARRSSSALYRRFLLWFVFYFFARFDGGGSGSHTLGYIGFTVKTLFPPNRAFDFSGAKVRSGKGGDGTRAAFDELEQFHAPVRSTEANSQQPPSCTSAFLGCGTLGESRTALRGASLFAQRNRTSSFRTLRTGSWPRARSAIGRAWISFVSHAGKDAACHSRRTPRGTAIAWRCGTEAPRRKLRRVTWPIGFRGSARDGDGVFLKVGGPLEARAKAAHPGPAEPPPRGRPRPGSCRRIDAPLARMA